MGEDAAGCHFSIGHPIDNATASVCRSLYYAAVTQTDYHVGMVLDELKSSELEAQTAVMLIGDHGELRFATSPAYEP